MVAKNLCDAGTPGIPRHVLAPQVYEFVNSSELPRVPFPDTFGYVLRRV